MWHENILWPEDLDGIPTTVVLSGQDQIVPSYSVRRFLEAAQADRDRDRDRATKAVERQQRCPKGPKGCSSSSPTRINVLWYQDMAHAGFLGTGSGGALGDIVAAVANTVYTGE